MISWIGQPGGKRGWISAAAKPAMIARQIVVAWLARDDEAVSTAFSSTAYRTASSHSLRFGVSVNGINFCLTVIKKMSDVEWRHD